VDNSGGQFYVQGPDTWVPQEQTGDRGVPQQWGFISSTHQDADLSCLCGETEGEMDLE